MNFINDPLGKALNDYYEGKIDATLTVYSDIDGEETLDAAYFFRGLEEMPDLEKIALKYCKGKVLDVGAGAGCHSIVLQEKGFNVTALDVSPGLIHLLQKRGLKRVLQEDIFQYKHEQFDTLLMLMNGIGLGGSLEKTDMFLEHSKKILTPNGQILFDSSDILEAFTEEDGSMLINLTREYYGVVEYQLKYEDILGEKFNWLYVDVDTLTQRAFQNGYNCEVLEVGEDNDYLGRLTLI